MDKRTPEQFLTEEGMPIEEKMYFEMSAFLYESPYFGGNNQRNDDLPEKYKPYMEELKKISRMNEIKEANNG